ncbi:MAG: GNAT family N-acetyltransferase [Burkholderiales bacterium]|nr:GNAT family N-acetyltransferase [Burkholderiales bacterium]
MVAPGPTISSCGGGDFDALLPLLDQEFIFGKGRKLSLRQRFPDLLDAKQAENILIAKVEARIASALATKAFSWTTPERSWRAAMIGLVYTRPELRGQGTASALLRATQAKLAQEGCDFAVLWTSRPDFYARQGWSGIDCGMLGSVRTASADTRAPAMPAPSSAIDWIEALRASHAPKRAERTEMTYASLYPPAQRLELLRSDGAYAIVGRSDDHAYLYEILGDESELPALWARMGTRYAALYLNLQRGNPAERFLSTQEGISWQEQRLAMWLPLSAAGRDAPYADWYIPFLDRI